MLTREAPKPQLVRGMSLILLLATQLLYVDSLGHLVATDDGVFGVGLTGTELTHDAGLLKLPLELLEGPFDVLALLDGNYDHFMFCFVIELVTKTCAK